MFRFIYPFGDMARQVFVNVESHEMVSPKDDKHGMWSSQLPVSVPEGRQDAEAVV